MKKEKMKTTNIIAIIVALILLVLFLTGVTLGIISSRRCKNECRNRGTIFYKTIKSGNFDLDDLCICYFEKDKIETFIISELK